MVRYQGWMMDNFKRIVNEWLPSSRLRKKYPKPKGRNTFFLKLFHKGVTIWLFSFKVVPLSIMNSVPKVDICHFQDSVRHNEFIMSREQEIYKRHKDSKNDIKINILFSLNIILKCYYILLPSPRYLSKNIK